MITGSGSRHTEIYCAAVYAAMIFVMSNSHLASHARLPRSPNTLEINCSLESSRRCSMGLRTWSCLREHQCISSLLRCCIGLLKSLRSSRYVILPIPRRYSPTSKTIFVLFIILFSSRCGTTSATAYRSRLCLFRMKIHVLLTTRSSFMSPRGRVMAPTCTSTDGGGISWKILRRRRRLENILS